jgi:hypothetical protein
MNATFAENKILEIWRLFTVPGATVRTRLDHDTKMSDDTVTNCISEAYAGPVAVLGLH